MGHAISDSIGNGDATWGALEQLVGDVQRTRAQIARLQAEEARLLTDAAGVVRAREELRRAAGRRTAHDLPLREVTTELGAAMRLSDRTVQARMSAASTLVDRFPKTLRALRKGRIDLAHASAIADSGASIADEVMRAEYERVVLEAAKYETPPRLRAIARVVAARLDPEMAAELQRCALGSRRVRVVELGDGMARLLADLPAVLAYAIFDRLTQMADITGGQAFFPQSTKMLTAIYEKVLAQIRAQYSLGFTSSNALKDGTWRRLEVRLKGQHLQELKVRSRKGYFAPFRPPASADAGQH